MARVLEDGEFSRVSLAEIQALVEQYGTAEVARARARELASRAEQELESFSDSPYRDALRSLAGFVIERQY